MKYKFNQFSVVAGGTIIMLLSGCSSGPQLKKIVLDESGSKPNWVDKSQIAWEEDGKIKFKSTQQVRGNERLSACYDLAKLNSKEAVISEIQEEIKGVIDSHESTLSESAELLLNKSRSAQLSGNISGLRFTEDYFVRYQIGDNERIDCFVLGEVSASDYRNIKKAVLEKVEAADPRLKQEITKKHINFFSNDRIVASDRD